jgi:hypothetical protein
MKNAALSESRFSFLFRNSGESLSVILKAALVILRPEGSLRVSGLDFL